jgi:hypothetical protein
VKNYVSKSPDFFFVSFFVSLPLLHPVPLSPGAEVKEYLQHELVLDLVHNYSLLLLRAMTFPATVNYQVGVSGYLSICFVFLIVL